MSSIENKKSLDWGTPSNPTHWTLKAGPIINEHNKVVYLGGVWMLGGISIISLIGIIGLSAMGKEIPQALVALGSASVGALGSLFTQK